MIDIITETNGLVKVLSNELRTRKIKVSFAESCTGGLASKLITDMPGASDFFECGVVSYSSRIKHIMLNVDEDLIAQRGVVSADVAIAMADGVRRVSGADIGIGITGVAGPGPDGQIPEGDIYVALHAGEKISVRAIHTKTENERDYNRYFAVKNAFEMIIELFGSESEERGI